MNPGDFRTYAEAKRLFFAFYSRRRTAVPDEYRAFMAGGEAVDVLHAGRRLEVRAWGTGPTVLLAHGLFAAGGAFRAMAPLLVDAGFRAVVFDAPGHGASPGHFAHTDEVADAMLSIEAHIGPLTAVVGHSFGAVWALHARRMGLRVARVACISIPAESDVVLEWFARETDASRAALVQLKRLIEAFDGPDVWARYSPIQMVAEVDVPGLVIHDRGDPIADPEGAERLARAWPFSRLCWTERLGHFHTVSSPQVAREIIEFLRQERS